MLRVISPIDVTPDNRNVGLLVVDTLSWKCVTEIDTHGKVKRTRDIEARYLIRPSDLAGE